MTFFCVFRLLRNNEIKAIYILVIVTGVKICPHK